MDNLFDFSSRLSTDYWKLYESGYYTDLSIQVGKGSDSKIFFVHSVVLCTRCNYFADSLTGDTEASSKEIQKISVTLEDMMPDVFEVLLRFIYTGKVPSKSYKHIDWFNFLKGAIMLELDDLIAAVEDFLVTENKELIQQNLLAVRQYAQSTVKLNRLLDYCNQTMALHPEFIFKSDNLLNLPKETLIVLLQNDDLNMKEGDIWMSVVEWAIGQVPGLTNDPSNWSADDVSTIKGLVTDCIPHVRFRDISYEDLFEKFVLYDELLPRKLRNDIFAYHLQNKTSNSQTQLLRGYKNREARTVIKKPTFACKPTPVNDRKKINRTRKNLEPDINVTSQEDHDIRLKIMKTMPFFNQ